MSRAKTHGQHKETAFRRHPSARAAALARRDTCNLSSPISPFRSTMFEGKELDLLGPAAKSFLSLPFVEVRSEVAPALRRRAEGCIDKAVPGLFARPRRCERRASRCLYSRDLERGLPTCPFLLTPLPLKKGLFRAAVEKKTTTKTAVFRGLSQVLPLQAAF